MNENEIILYGKGAYGTKIWKIWSVSSDIIIEANGATYHEPIAGGLAGRSLNEQIKLRINARVRSKLDDGFKHNESELGDIITNQLGRARPMLATHFKDCKNLREDNCYVQPKLDGHRCLIDADGAYSRAGRVIDTIPEIVDSITVPEGMILDGELYCHGEALQTISSWAKRRQPNTLKLKYHIYDVIIQKVSFIDRLEIIRNLKYNDKFVDVVNTQELMKLGGVTTSFKLFKDIGGYEGSILRPAKGLYEPGKRSKTLIKVKSRYDEEFECIDVVPTKWGWGNLVLKTKEGLSFKTPAPGTLAEKTRQLINKELYIGKFITCEFADWTIEKKPFHCVAIRWREDL